MKKCQKNVCELPQKETQGGTQSELLVHGLAYAVAWQQGLGHVVNQPNFDDARTHTSHRRTHHLVVTQPSYRTVYHIASPVCTIACEHASVRVSLMPVP